MAEKTTKEPLRVYTHPEARPSIPLLASQVAELRDLLDRHGISYWVNDFTVALNGGPPRTTLWVERQVDADRVQRLIDEAGLGGQGRQ